MTSDRVLSIIQQIIAVAITASGAWLFIAVALDPMPHKTLYEIGGTIGAVAGYGVSEIVLRHRK